MSSHLPVGSYVRIAKAELQALVQQLKERGYRTIGPRVSDGAVIYDEMDAVQDMPIGVIDQQDGGTYRLKAQDENSYFDYVVGPHSLKNYLFPPRDTVLEAHRVKGSWQLESPAVVDRPLAVIGPRACDLHALEVQDRVFLHGTYVDPAYKARRENLFVVAVNCRRAVATCFCHSMKTGPAVKSNFDLALTELEEFFVVEVGSERGGEIIAAAEWVPCSMETIRKATELPKQLEKQMRQRQTQAGVSGNGEPRPRFLDTTEIRNLLLNNVEHPRWEEVAQRCLSCANCTMVCPTCFCSSVEDVADLTGGHVRRERSWASCFTAEHSYMHSGVVRKSTASRYRQWLTHKLASWMDQFGTSGCTGCGRCITWCPVGIDLTEEVAAIRGEES
jgi:ferredoxin